MFSLISLYVLFLIVIHFLGMLVYRPILNYKNSYLTPRLGGMNQRDGLLAQSFNLQSVFFYFTL